MGNSSIHGPFSMAMLNNQKVIQTVLKVAFLCVFFPLQPVKKIGGVISVIQ